MLQSSVQLVSGRWSAVGRFVLTSLAALALQSAVCGQSFPLTANQSSTTDAARPAIVAPSVNELLPVLHTQQTFANLPTPPAPPMPSVNPLAANELPPLVSSMQPGECISKAQPAAESSEKKFAASLALYQDIFLGFYPFFLGSYNITDQTAFTFYTILFNNPGFTPSGQTGTGLWTEVGVGLSHSVLDGQFVFIPQIGTLSGALLSGRDRPQVFEGVVPSLIINHNSKYTEGQFYSAYYIATAAPSDINFIHWWIFGGVKPFAESSDWRSILSTGIHFQQLHQTKNKPGEAQNLFTWLGPYIQFKLPNGTFLQFTAGWDLQRNTADTFYRLVLGFSL